MFLKEIDFTTKDHIDYSEFLANMFNFKKHLNDSLVQKMFDIIDTNHDGMISEQELGKFLNFNEEQRDFLKELMDQADQNKDGIISFDEFKAVLLK